MNETWLLSNLIGWSMALVGWSQWLNQIRVNRQLRLTIRQLQKRDEPGGSGDSH